MIQKTPENGQKSRKPRLLVLNDPNPMRISGELAAEIGLNESIVLLQLEFLISISNTQEHDGYLWTYQSLNDLHDKYFKWWHPSTISRILISLEKMGLIRIGNFNKRAADRTQWYALDEDGISRLKSVMLDNTILQLAKSIRANCKMKTRKLQNENAQTATTLPDTSTETPTEISTEIPSSSYPPQDETKTQEEEGRKFPDDLVRDFLSAGIFDYKLKEVETIANKNGWSDDQLRALMRSIDQDGTARSTAALFIHRLRHTVPPREKTYDLPAQPAALETPADDEQMEGLAADSWQLAMSSLVGLVDSTDYTNFLQAVRLSDVDYLGGVFSIYSQNPWHKSRLEKWQEQIESSLQPILGNIELEIV